MTGKHTPGPWEPVRWLGDPAEGSERPAPGWIIEAGMVEVAFCEPAATVVNPKLPLEEQCDLPGGGGHGAYDVTDAECEANAKLIAAAPELADALAALVERLDGDRNFVNPDGGAEMLVTARAALRAAGRTR